MSLIKVIKTVGGQKKYGIEFTQEPSLNSVSRLVNSKTGDVEGFATMKKESHKRVLEVDPKSFDNEPMIPLNRENFGVLVSGEARTGKSAMGAILIQQYDVALPNNKMFLISQKRKEIDRNFKNIKKLRQLNLEEIEAFNINDYENCLFVIDDSDFGKGKKAVMELLNLICTVGAEQHISWIFITHNNSKLNDTNAFKEFNIYITYQNNLTNNRMLYQNMGFSVKQIEEFKAMNSAYYIFNRIYDVLITEFGVKKYGGIAKQDEIKYHEQTQDNISKENHFGFTRPSNLRGVPQTPDPRKKKAIKKKRARN